MRLGRAAAAIAIVAAILVFPISAHSGLEVGEQIGFAEKLGSYAALDASFIGEDGGAVDFRGLTGQPLLLVLGYYRCTNECNTLYTGLAKGLRDIQGVPGKDFKVVSVSISDHETTKDSKAKKAIALASIERPFPPEDWRFLLGDDKNIDAIADSVGFSYRKVGEDYDHPLGVVVLAPDGKIVRYLIGPDFLPIDLNMAVMEASAGLVRPTIAKMLRFCVSYDPNKKQYGFNILRVSALVTTILVASLAVILIVAGKRRRRVS